MSGLPSTLRRRRYRVPYEALSAVRGLPPYAAVRALGQAQRHRRRATALAVSLLVALLTSLLGSALSRRLAPVRPPAVRQTQPISLIQPPPAPKGPAAAAAAAAPPAPAPGREAATPALPPRAASKRRRPAVAALSPPRVASTRSSLVDPQEPFTATSPSTDPALRPVDLTATPLPTIGAIAAAWPDAEAERGPAPGAAGIGPSLLGGNGTVAAGTSAGATGGTGGTGTAARSGRPRRTQWSCAWPPAHISGQRREVLVQIQVHLNSLGRPQQVDVLEAAPAAFILAARACALRESFRAAHDAQGNSVAAVTAPFTVRFIR